MVLSEASTFLSRQHPNVMSVNELRDVSILASMFAAKLQKSIKALAMLELAVDSIG
jgi:hypothetical protein